MNTDELLNNSSNNNSEQQQTSNSTTGTAVPVVVKKKLSQKQKKELRKQRQQPHKPRPANLETFNTFRKRNNLLEKYYSELQKVLKDEEELNEFIHSFQQPLPIAFRINHTLQFPEKIIKKIKAFAESIKDVRVDKASTKEYLNPTPITASNNSEDNNIATVVEQQQEVNSTTVVEAKEDEEECTPEYASLHPVSYIPNEMVWQMNDNVSKTLLRKHPAFAEFRDFLMKETERGNIRIRKIMFISPSVRKFLEQNEKEGNKYNVVNCGIRVFERANAAFLRCPFRITQEAAHILWNHMDDTRKVVLNENNFKYFLIEPHTPVEVLRKNGQSDVADKIEKAEPGGVLVKLEEEDGCDEILAVGLKGALTLARHIKLEIAQAVLKSLGSEEEIKKYTKSYLEKRQQGSGDKVLDEMLLNEEEL
ncbi:hypothetical protein ABK040_016240 [Willaertia magna]